MSHLLDKREKDMNPQEKLKLEIMRTVRVLFRRESIRGQFTDFDFRSGCDFSIVTDKFLKRFKIEFRNKDDVNNFWPEKETKWPEIKKQSKKQSKKGPKNPVTKNDTNKNKNKENEKDKNKTQTDDKEIKLKDQDKDKDINVKKE